MGETYVRSSGLPYAIFRLFNVYGPGDPPGRYRNAVPNMMRALDSGGPIRIFGRDATRDFTYVDDVVRVLLDAPRAAGQVVNVGTGQETPIIELARQILRLFDLPESRMSFEEPRSWDRVVRRCASVERLQALYGWVPSTPLADGLARGRALDARGRLRRTEGGVKLPERILFVGAHCDDVELFAGGLLARACFAAQACRRARLQRPSRRARRSRGGAGAGASSLDNLAWLRAESGTDVRDHCGSMLPACRGAFEAERGKLYAAMEALRDDYDLVVTHAPTDTNQDHQQVAKEARAGLQGARHAARR